MSEENVELIRRQLDAFTRGDRTAWLASLDEDYEITPIGDWPDARVIRGGEAGWDFYLDVAQTLGYYGRIHVEFVDGGGDKVLAHQRHEGRGQASGVDVEADYWLVITLREGKVLRDQWFTDRAEALEAAGLRE
jgi:ketosteroid isomerase-like protein